MERYKVDRVIARGTFAEILCAVEKTFGEPCAIKRSSVKPPELAIPKHENILQPFHTFTEHARFHTVSELLDGDLFTIVTSTGGLDNRTTAHLFKQVCGGVNALHQENLAHRDIKLENILIDIQNVRAVVCDFDFLCLAGKADRRCGSLPYCPPEILLDKPVRDARQSDCWSLGIVLFGMLHGSLPFGDEHSTMKNTMYRRICEGEYNLGARDSILEEIIKATLKSNPEDRPSTKEMIEMLDGDYNMMNEEQEEARETLYKALNVKEASSTTNSTIQDTGVGFPVERHFYVYSNMSGPCVVSEEDYQLVPIK